MTIWLANKTLEDLVKIPLELKNERLNIEPNKDNEVYVFDDFLVHYKLVSEGTMDYFGSAPISKYLGTALPFYHQFKDVNGKLDILDYWIVELWDQIPEGFRDVIFFHEIIELKYLSQNFEISKAHNLSVNETKEYLQKHLSIIEKRKYSKLIDSMKER